jgi:hypothetical protein
MLPPVLEIYVVWHPGDAEGAEAADQIVHHFHGTSFSGLIGGAVEVFVRSEGWTSNDDAPRPLPITVGFPNGVAEPEFVAVVPVLGRELAFELEKSPDGPWERYIKAIVDARNDKRDRVAVFPLEISPGVLEDTRLGGLLGGIQGIGIASEFVAEKPADLRCRDLAQALAQFLAPTEERLRVFVSHTKRAGVEGSSQLHALIGRTRYLISNTRLGEFFDANTLQAGTDWAKELVKEAGRGALLALRTDLYATRRWCQNEMVTAKYAGVPVVILDALDDGEERGSFLMDHVPRIPGGPKPADGAIMKALNQLVDECLKRALWTRQQELAAGDPELDVAWWAPHAPEPVTLAVWLRKNPPADDDTPVRILHPDPPLGPDELDALAALAALAGAEGRLEVMTPRGLAARGA